MSVSFLTSPLLKIVYVFLEASEYSNLYLVNTYSVTLAWMSVLHVSSSISSGEVISQSYFPFTETRSCFTITVESLVTELSLPSASALFTATVTVYFPSGYIEESTAAVSIPSEAIVPSLTTLVPFAPEMIISYSLPLSDGSAAASTLILSSALMLGSGFVITIRSSAS